MGQVVAKGDSLEMQYTGWLHAGNAFGKVRTNNYHYYPDLTLTCTTFQKVN